jgi:cell division protein FtsW
MSRTATRERRASAAATRQRAGQPVGTRSSTAVLLVATVAVLNVVGVVMVLSASSVASLTDYGSPWYFFFRQLIWSALGLVAFVFAIRIDYRSWRRLVRPLLIVSAALLVVVLVPGVGIYVSGSRRWLGAGAVRFQPSELAKLALLLYAADLASRRAGEVHDWRRVVKPVGLVLGGFALLVMREPDLGSALVLALIVVAVLVAGGVRPRHLGLVAALGVSAVTLLAMLEPYRRARMLTFLHPFADSANAGYQISQSLIALGSGGLTGVGLGAGRAKWNFLPNAHTDFIFAIIGEELGLIGCILVIGLFITFGILGTRAALRAPDRFGALLAAGITMWVVGQAVINIGAVVGLLPVTGIPLPFVSFGGSALITTMLASGMLVNIAGQDRRVTPPRTRADARPAPARPR